MRSLRAAAATAGLLLTVLIPATAHAGARAEANAAEPENVALTATASASYTPGWVTADNINDGVLPTGPIGPNEDVWNTWPQVGEQWVQLDWPTAVTVGRSRVWFTQDIDGDGFGVAPPSAWKLQYRTAAGVWADVEQPSAYGTQATDWNTVTFAPVTTTSLRALLTASGAEEGKGAPGVQEWEVFDNGAAPQYQVEVQAKTQCFGGTAFASVNARNADDEPLTIALSTPFGARTATGVAPGRSAYQSFNARTATVAAGSATVTVTGPAGTSEIKAPYPAVTC
ncbi:hypothetical protein [Dactylosporangium sp. NPDC051541]|uniref:galactose-binding domain-containing protein n=1 Tax=Dactylosporangium sp. NPDC051541 TaxID=3363977 RepID=UPI00379D1877